jgi:hypothetical protein
VASWRIVRALDERSAAGLILVLAARPAVVRAEDERTEHAQQLSPRQLPLPRNARNARNIAERYLAPTEALRGVPTSFFVGTAAREPSPRFPSGCSETINKAVEPRWLAPRADVFPRQSIPWCSAGSAHSAARCSFWFHSHLRLHWCASPESQLHESGRDLRPINVRLPPARIATNHHHADPCHRNQQRDDLCGAQAER